MIKQLKDCKINDIVRMYCIGWCSFDNQLSKIIEKDSTCVTVINEIGLKSHFVPTAKCISL